MIFHMTKHSLTCASLSMCTALVYGNKTSVYVVESIMHVEVHSYILDRIWTIILVGPGVKKKTNLHLCGKIRIRGRASIDDLILIFL